MWGFASNVWVSRLGRKSPPNCSSSNVACSDDEASSCTSREEGLECPICWESFNIVENIPYVLWCGHTMCKNCILGMENEVPGEVLKAVFPLLNGKDLVFCMLVCRQWHEIAKDDYFWKCICARKWPSICKQPPSDANYQKLYITFSKPRKTQHLPVPRLTFEDLVFYIDMWLEGPLIFSQAVSGCTLRAGLQCAPRGIPDILAAHINTLDCIMMMEVEPKLAIPTGQAITVSVLAHRKDTNKMACIINESTFEYIDSNAARALAYEYLQFSPRNPFISDIRAWLSLLFLSKGSNVIEVFGIELDFCDAARSETEILWLLDMLDWK